jgi:hypothetical protein
MYHQPQSTIAASVLFTGFFVVMCMDTNDLRVSSAWCRNGLSGVNWSEQPAIPVDCDYLRVILMILTDFMTVVLWVRGVSVLFGVRLQSVYAGCCTLV